MAAPLSHFLHRSRLLVVPPVLSALALFAAGPLVAQLEAGDGATLEQLGVGAPLGPGTDDRYGASLAAGDFDSDGFDELVVGTPGETVGLATFGGRIAVYAGGPDGPDPASPVTWDAGDFGALGFAPENGARFGEVVAAGDFDDDGYDDLAIASPFATVVRADGSSHAAAGVVFVLYGSPSGLGVAGQQAWRQGHGGLAGVAEAGDRIGEALAVGDVDGDGFDDLAIGAPREDVGTVEDMGGVNLLLGSAAGLSANYSGEQVWTKETFGLSDEEDAHFGAALAFGDFRGDGADDLAIGLPDEDLTGANDGGAFVVAQGLSPSGLAEAGYQLLTKGGVFVPGEADHGERFGAAFAAGDFDGDGFDDLAIGSPGERVSDGEGGELYDVGAVTVLRGSSPGGLTGVGFGARIEREDFDDAAGLDRFGAALAAGDFGDDGVVELVIGAPGAAPLGIDGAGTAYAISLPTSSPFASALELRQAGGALGEPQPYDGFGASLVAGDFDGSRFPDLAVGVPFEDAGAVGNAGAANLFPSLGLFRDDFASGNVARWSHAVGD